VHPSHDIRPGPGPGSGPRPGAWVLPRPRALVMSHLYHDEIILKLVFASAAKLMPPVPCAHAAAAANGQLPPTFHFATTTATTISLQTVVVHHYR
jgi:hypothetical protein